MSEKISVWGTSNYTREELKEFNKIGNFFAIKRYRQKSLWEYAFLILSFNVLFWFSKGYFTKLGDLVAQDSYKRFKDITYRILKNNQEGKEGLLGLYFYSSNDPDIKFFIKASSEKSFNETLDSLNYTYANTLKILKNERRNVSESRITLIDMRIAEFYYTTREGELFVIEKS